MEFTNEYKLDTPENREWAIRHIAHIAGEGMAVFDVQEDGSKTLVKFARQADINPECGLPYNGPRCGSMRDCASICGLRE